VVVVDNGSSDGTPTAVAGRFPEVEVLALDRNLGSAARTVGVEAVREPYVALCDDDSWWAPGSLPHAERLLDDHSRLALIAGRVLVGEGLREDPTCRAMDLSPLPRRAGQAGPRFSASWPALRSSGGRLTWRWAASIPTSGSEERRRCSRWTSQRPAGSLPMSPKWSRTTTRRHGWTAVGAAGGRPATASG
jgi:Glycosyl transferase family 2